jgi:uncharacterized RmlC-like cupin family protein
MRVRCPHIGSGWATVIYIYSSGRVEIEYPGDRYAVEVDAGDLIY